MGDIKAPQMTVLLAVDGSACAQVALDLVRSLRWPADTTIHVVTALEPAAFAYVPVVDAEQIGGAASWLKGVAASLDATGAHIQPSVLAGRPATAIVERAAAIGADLIVVGSRGNGTITSMILGSVSAEVADHAHCPVLVARQHEVARVIMATDGSGFARSAEDVLATWPVFERLPVEVVSVVDVHLPWTSSLALSADASTEDYAHLEDDAVAAHQQIVSATAKRLAAAGRSVDCRVLEGDPASELIRVAAEEQKALVVVGTHGTTGLHRILAGSVARNVMLHARSSVMVVREIRASATAQTG